MAGSGCDGSSRCASTLGFGSLVASWDRLIVAQGDSASSKIGQLRCGCMVTFAAGGIGFGRDEGSPYSCYSGQPGGVVRGLYRYRSAGQEHVQFWIDVIRVSHGLLCRLGYRQVVQETSASQ